MFGLTPFRRNRDFLEKRDTLSPWRAFDRMFDEFFRDGFLSPWDMADTMKVDIKETDQEYWLEAEIPGVDKKDIQLEMDDDILTIRVQRNEETNVESDRYIRKERRTASMSRSFHVENVKQDEVTAKYKDGILQIRLPKQNPGISKGRIIDIQ